MGERKVNKLPAFTILEVTVVVAILGVLITIITTALNRFNEQLKVNQDIQKELTNWMLVRANLWNEYYLSDSIYLSEETVVLSQPDRNIYYRSDNELLMRQEQSKNLAGSSLKGWLEMNIPVSSIILDTVNGEAIVITFPLKGDDMELRLPKRNNKANVVNNYYEQFINE